MLVLWSAVALGAPPDDDVEIVREKYEEIAVRITFPGREGDMVRCDGWPLGKLPVETELLKGVHTFEVRGTSGTFKLTTELLAPRKGRLALDLSTADPVQVEVPAGIQVIGDSPRRADGSVATETAETNKDQAPKTPPAPVTP